MLVSFLRLTRSTALSCTVNSLQEINAVPPTLASSSLPPEKLAWTWDYTKCGHVSRWVMTLALYHFCTRCCTCMSCSSSHDNPNGCLKGTD